MLRGPRLLGVAVAAGLAVWAAIGFYRAQVRHNLWPRNFGVVVEGKVYRGAAQTPAMLRALVEQHKIRTVVDLGAFNPETPEGRFDTRQMDLTCRALGVERFAFRLRGDGTGDANEYVKALHVMADLAKQPVLVHCATGAQRTTACVAFYRHTLQDWTLDDAYAEGLRFKASAPPLKPYIDEYAGAIRSSFRSGAHIPVGSAR